MLKSLSKKINVYAFLTVSLGELIGIEYLYDQTGRPLQEYSHEIEKMEDSGLDVPEEEEGLVEPEVGSLLNEGKCCFLKTKSVCVSLYWSEL